MPDYPRRCLPQQFLPLTVPVFHILLALSDRDLHGYAVIQDIRERTGGEVDLTASTLYAAIKRMLDGRLIEELDTRPGPEDDDPRRRYYKLTLLGREAARAEAVRIEALAAAARAKGLLARTRSATGRA